MKVPNAAQAFVPFPKLADYLLNEAHPRGGPKARFFRQKGFNLASLAQMLLHHVQQHEIETSLSEVYGQKLVVEGEAVGPNGDAFWLRSVWYILEGEKSPIFVTAYPLRK